MSQPTSIDGCLYVWKLFAGGTGGSLDLGNTKGWSVQIDGELGGGAVIFEASNNGSRFYDVDALAAVGLHTVDDSFRHYRPVLKDASENAAVTITIYTY